MKIDSTVVPLRQPDTIEAPLTAILRSGARRLLAQAIEAEAEAFLTAMKGVGRRSIAGRAAPHEGEAMMIRTLIVCLLALGVATPVLAADPAKSLSQARIAAGEVMFRQNCMACHSPDPSKNAFGPTLAGVIGRSAGTLPRFAYSDALKKSGIVWTEDSLRLWLADNEKLVPGTRMKHVSITDPAAQDFLIAYIGSL